MGMGKMTRMPKTKRGRPSKSKSVKFGRISRFNKSHYTTKAGDGITSTLAFPKSMVARLRYCQKGQINSAGVITHNLFRANGPYDPYQTGVGHQSMGYDQYSTLYNHQTTYGAKIKVQFWSEDSATAYKAIGGIFLTDDTNIAANGGDASILMENGKSNWKLIDCNPDHGASFRTLENTFSAKKWFSVKDIKDTTERIGSSVGNTPTEEAYFCIWLASPDGQTDLPALDYLVTIEYFIVFTEPKELAQS